MTKYICVHGHFYQPPRENAWLEKIEVQDTAYPFHDWNERITQECYFPNSVSRILDENGVIKNIVNNYAGISYNFGPTLLSWLKEMAPVTYASILDADKHSANRFGGHGSAVAQAYNHMIMPLANERDKDTQVFWSIRDFETRFGRLPEGMWLGETAVNTECLEVMAKYGIKFTILAPRQASKIRKIGDEKWIDVSGEKVNPKRPYVCNLPSGKSIVIYYYDGQVAKDVAFNGLLGNGKSFAERLLSALDKSSDEPELEHIATDGESYGHHHRHGDMALAVCLDHIFHGTEAKVTNYGQFMELHPPLYETQIVENSSWSCVHGVERWRSNCGCHTGGQEGWNQEWRFPLRDALDWLRDNLILIYEKEGKDLFKDIWKARQDYIDIIQDRSEDVIDAFFKKHGKNISENGRKSKALRLLEIQRHSMLMYTSCGWFFNEVSGIETIQILEYASRAIQLAEQISDNILEKEFITRLEYAKSNVPEHENAGRIYENIVLKTKVTLMRVGMHYGVATLFADNPEKLSVFNYTTSVDFFDKREAGIQKISYGRISVRSNTTYTEKQFSFVSLYLGQHNIVGYISVNMTEEVFNKMYKKVNLAFSKSNIEDIMRYLRKYFGNKTFSIWHLFKDEKRQVFDQIVGQYLGRVDYELRQIYDQDYQLVNAISQEDIPIPKIYLHTFEFVLNSELRECLQTDPLDINQLNELVSKFKKWNLELDPQIPYDRIISQTINRILGQLSQGKEALEILKRLNRGFEIIKEFNLHPNLHNSQNAYFQMASEGEIPKMGPEIEDEFKKLGLHLRIVIDQDELINSFVPTTQ